jgi:probable rRNA maturation factor
MVDVVNLQRKVKLDASIFTAFVVTLRSAIREVECRSFTVALISDRRMTELNKFFRGIESTTDVLSFPYEADKFESDRSNLGDIVISAERARDQAKENKLTLELEIKQLILHGVLHLCGYDHENDTGEMNDRELELRKELHIQG